MADRSNLANVWNRLTGPACRYVLYRCVASISTSSCGTRWGRRCVYHFLYCYLSRAGLLRLIWTEMVLVWSVSLSVISFKFWQNIQSVHTYGSLSLLLSLFPLKSHYRFSSDSWFTSVSLLLMVIAPPPGFNMCLRSPENQVDVDKIVLKYRRCVCRFLFYGRLGGGCDFKKTNICDFTLKPSRIITNYNGHKEHNTFENYIKTFKTTKKKKKKLVTCKKWALILSYMLHPAGAGLWLFHY